MNEEYALEVCATGTCRGAIPSSTPPNLWSFSPYPSWSFVFFATPCTFVDRSTSLSLHKAFLANQLDKLTPFIKKTLKSPEKVPLYWLSSLNSDDQSSGIFKPELNEALFSLGRTTARNPVDLPTITGRAMAALQVEKPEDAQVTVYMNIRAADRPD